MENEKLESEVKEKEGRLDGIPATTLKIKTYKRRWLQLGLFFVYNAASSSQWIQFTIIANIICRYYSVSSSAVDWTSIIFYLAYVILFLPVSYVMNRVGLRLTCVIGAVVTTIGAWIKVFAVYPDRFFLLLLGQTVVASTQIFILNGPPLLAATWFGPAEVATATAIACSGGMIGGSLLFLITPIIVKNHERIEDIGEELSIFYVAVAVVCTLVTVAIFVFFEDEPQLPPSEARGLQIINRGFGSEEFFARCTRILKNKSFLLIWNLFGINAGGFNAISTLLNPLFLIHFQNGEADAGRLGFIFNFMGNFGAIVFGMILDKTKKFKAASIIIYVFTIVGEILFALSLIMEIKWLAFVSISVIGICTISYATLSFELSAEATYPEPEEVPSTLLNAAQQFYGMTLSLIAASLLRNYGDKAAHACLIAILTLGLILAFFSKNDLRRQNAKEETSYSPIALSKSDQIDVKTKTDYI